MLLVLLALICPLLAGWRDIECEVVVVTRVPYSDGDARVYVAGERVTDASREVVFSHFYHRGYDVAGHTTNVIDGSWVYHSAIWGVWTLQKRRDACETK